MQNYRSLLFIIAFFSFVSAGLPVSRFINYVSPQSVNAILEDHGIVWAGTDGGLFRYDRAAKTGTLYSDPVSFPDPSISCLSMDANRTLWQGTARGYLYKRSAAGEQTVANPYFMGGWQLTSLCAVGKYLVVGADKGCSVFDTDRFAALKNATNFGNAVPNPKVNAVAVFRDTLLLGLERGVAKLHLGAKTLADTNFFDPSIWIIDTTDGLPVKSFIIKSDKYQQIHALGISFKDTTITSQTSTEVYAGVAKALTLPSVVTSMAVSGDGAECYLGTKSDYFFVWDGVTSRNVKINGPTFTVPQRVMVDHAGATWVCPTVTMKGMPDPWWEGISNFTNGNWRLFSETTDPHMGSFGGGNHEFRGITEDRYGHVWFGAAGYGQVRRWNRGDGSWSRFCVGAALSGDGSFVKGIPCDSANWLTCQSLINPTTKIPLFSNGLSCPYNDWAKCDAIASDSSGYVWIANWSQKFGCLVCYDSRYEPDTSAKNPVDAHYRRFWPQGDANFATNFSMLCVDVAGNIIAGSDNGNIMVFSHTGNPLRDSVTIKMVGTGKGIPYDAVATSDTLTRIATSTGLYTYDPVLNKLTNGICIRTLDLTGDRDNDPYVGMVVDSVIDSTISEVQAVEAEDARFLWFGTATKGLVRYDVANRTSMIIDQTQGLLSNTIKDLAIDARNGYLWVATDRGMSRYSIGYAVSGIKNSGATVTVYPNPFSKRRHQEVVFEKLPPKCKVAIYSVSGSLVSALAPADSAGNGATCSWKPAQNTAPGIYLFTVRAGRNSKTGKIVVTP
jgi:hypothetical protein